MMNLNRISEATGLSLSECRAYRIEYLRRHIQERSEDVAWFANRPGELSDAFCKSVFDEVIIEANELRHLTMLAKGYSPSPNTITDEMIQAARDFPVDRLIEFDRTGKAIAFCHADNHPSLSWHKSKNRVTCFPCAKSYNGIDILMKRDGCSFRDAVRQLAA